MRGSCTALAALALAAAGALGASRAVTDFDAPTPLWREGPVRYLLTKSEDETYRELTSDPDRAAFIQRFWASRDPVGSTPENEYRALFYARVAEANRLFTDSTKPGWKTDRGKIYVLLGPPDDFTVEDRGDLIPNSEVWTYRSPPGGQRAETLPAIRFTKDATGEYRISNDPILPGFDNPARLAFQIQSMQIKSLPEQKKILDSIVGARAASDTGPFRTHRDFFRSGDGQTFAVLTLGLKPDLLGKETGIPAGASSGGQEHGGAAGALPGGAPGLPPPAGRSRYEVVARLVGASPDLPAYDLAGPFGLRGPDGAPVRDPAGFLMFQTGLPIRPGSYTAYYGVIDHDSDRVFSLKEALEIPDLRERRFALSHITLASRLERLDATRTSYSTPFVLGNLRVLPRSDDLFRGGDEFAFYYQIYGADNDPIDGRPDLDVEYRFFVAQDDGAGGLKFEPLGRPIRLTRQRGQMQGYTLSLKDWRPGTYRLRVEVTDNLSERRSTEEISFRVQ